LFTGITWNPLFVKSINILFPYLLGSLLAPINAMEVFLSFKSSIN